jgi:hypothetical protein
MFPSNPTGAKVERARILIADATPMGAQLLADALRRSDRFAGVFSATRTTDVMALLANQPFDVLLISSNVEGDATGLKLAQAACISPKGRRWCKPFGRAARGFFTAPNR